MKSKNFKNWGKKQGRLLFDHIVFHVKYYKKMLTSYIPTRAKGIIQNVLERNQCKLVEINIQPNHVHLLFGFPPSVAPSNIIRKLKATSSVILRREFPELVEQSKKALWMPAVYHLSVGHDMKGVVQYIKNQNSHHKNTN
jgi:putative transposase